MESRRVAVAFAVLAIGLVVWPATTKPVRAQAGVSSVVGAWSLNRELSDPPRDQASDGDRREGRGDRRGGGGGFGRGGFGGGRRGGGGGGFGRAAVEPEQAARVREAIRDLMNPPDHLTIVQSENMVIITGPDGRTTRLSLDDKKVKDESTKIERKSKWDGSKLLSEVSGLGNAKIVESYFVEAEHHQLHLTVKSDNERRPFTINRVYDADQPR
jgi:hypothetical protein